MHTPMSLTGVHSFTIYDTRLGSSSTSPATSGRVEVLTQRGWMPVCANSWAFSESRVLCRQLGYSYFFYSENVIQYYYWYDRMCSHTNALLYSVGRTSSSDNSLQYSFSCSGSESSISQCPYTFSYERQTTCSYINTVYCASCRLMSTNYII